MFSGEKLISNVVVNMNSLVGTIATSLNCFVYGLTLINRHEQRVGLYISTSEFIIF